MLGEAAYPSYEDMLQLVAEDEPDDPRGRIDEQLGAALVVGVVALCVVLAGRTLRALRSGDSSRASVEG